MVQPMYRYPHTVASSCSWGVERTQSGAVSLQGSALAFELDPARGVLVVGVTHPIAGAAHPPVDERVLTRVLQAVFVNANGAEK